MTPKQFEKVTNDTFKKCDKVLNSKNLDYSRNNDKLHNFKVAGAARNQPPEYALGGMMLKHTISIYDYIDDTLEEKHHSLAEWDEKIVDHINYLLLLRGFIVERETK